MRTTRFCVALAAALLSGAASARADQLQTQSFSLQAGWNAIYLEVQPSPSDPASVFAGAPINSVWAWNPRPSPVDFIEDPAEGLFNRPGWLSYFPGPPESVLNNLFALQANRAYLVNASAPAVVNVTGRPSLRDTKWVPNSFNLVGFPVAPSGPTFTAYFAGSPAQSGQAIYSLDTAGVWQLIPASSTVERGVAYWVYSQGGSKYNGPTDVSVSGSDGLDFAQTATEMELRLDNLTGTGITVTLTALPSANAVPLTYWGLDGVGEVVWTDLTGPLSVSLAADEDTVVRLAVKREGMAGDLAEGVLEVNDGRGTRRLVPVRAEKLGAVLPFTFQSSLNPTVNMRALGPNAKVSLAPNAPAPPPYAGLWVGDVTVNAVSRSQYLDRSSCPVSEGPDNLPGTSDDCTPTQLTSLVTEPVRNEFRMRLILHVDDGNQVRLLKDVIQMWKDGTGGAAGHYALVTDDSLLTSFKGSGIRDGELVGRRASTIAYDFTGDSLPMTGSLSPTGDLTVTLSLPKEAASNPFKHKFHPDHDNLTPLGAPLAEAYDVTRGLHLAFSSTDPQGGTEPDWGTGLVGGTYTETLTGLHKNPIEVQGTFRLRRVSLVAQLNQ